MLDGETDVGYFDSFDSAEDMAKYAEVFKKQRDVEAVQEKGLGNRNNWVNTCSTCLWKRTDIPGRIHIRQKRCRSWTDQQASDRQASRRGSTDHVLGVPMPIRCLLYMCVYS